VLSETQQRLPLVLETTMTDNPYRGWYYDDDDDEDSYWVEDVHGIINPRPRYVQVPAGTKVTEAFEIACRCEAQEWYVFRDAAGGQVCSDAVLNCDDELHIKPYSHRCGFPTTIVITTNCAKAQYMPAEPAQEEEALREYAYVVSTYDEDDNLVSVTKIDTILAKNPEDVKIKVAVAMTKSEGGFDPEKQVVKPIDLPFTK
jgi:hypothetical protein